MFKWMAIVLAGVITFQSLHISAGDISGLDELVEHYRFHQKEYGDDLFTFMAKHYGADDSTGMDHQDEENHQGLPFQHNFISAHGPLAVVEPAEFTLSIPEGKVRLTDNFHTSFNSTLFVSKTFQPPKKS